MPALPARGLVAFGFLISGVAAAGPSRGDCPGGFVFLGAHVDTTWSTAAIFEKTLGIEDGCGRGRGGYDATTGTLSVDWWAGFVTEVAGCGMTDVYVVTGLPAGMPVAFAATLEVHAHVSNNCSSSACGNVVRARLIRDGSDAGEWLRDLSGTGERSLDETLSLPITVDAGVPFSLATSLSSHFGGATGCGSWSRLAGTLRFPGLPPGVHVTSCHGYAGVPVPAELVSWGSLKATYR